MCCADVIEYCATVLFIVPTEHLSLVASNCFLGCGLETQDVKSTISGMNTATEGSSTIIAGLICSGCFGDWGLGWGVGVVSHSGGWGRQGRKSDDLGMWKISSGTCILLTCAVVARHLIGHDTIGNGSFYHNHDRFVHMLGTGGLHDGDHSSCILANSGLGHVSSHWVVGSFSFALSYGSFVVDVVRDEPNPLIRCSSSLIVDWFVRRLCRCLRLSAGLNHWSVAGVPGLCRLGAQAPAYPVRSRPAWSRRVRSSSQSCLLFAIVKAVPFVNYLSARFAVLVELC